MLNRTLTQDTKALDLIVNNWKRQTSFEKLFEDAGFVQEFFDKKPLIVDVDIYKDGKKLNWGCLVYESEDERVYLANIDNSQYYCTYDGYLKDKFDFYIDYCHNGDLKSAYNTIIHEQIPKLPNDVEISIYHKSSKESYEVKPLDYSIIPEDNFVRIYIETMLSKSGGFAEYKFICGLILLATASDAKHCFILSNNQNTNFCYLNLYVMLIGPSSIAGKTTSMDEVKYIIKESNIGFKFSPELASKDAMIKSLANNPHQLLKSDECDSFLNAMRSPNSYQHDFDNIFNEL